MKKNLKNIKLFELNDAYQSVLYWFFSFPNMETTLSELAKNLKIAKTTAKRIVETLIDESFLIRKVYGRAWRITSDPNHVYHSSKKISFNLSMIYEAYHNGLRDLILEQVENAYSIILFGSYRKGDDDEKSDIDIAVEVADNEELRIIELGVIKNFGHRTETPINLHIFCRNKVDVNLFANIANGIVIEGFLEARP